MSEAAAAERPADASRGSLISTEPLTVRAAGGRVKLQDGRFSVAEESGRASGYAILNAASREEAFEFCRTFLKAAGDGEVELRQILDMPPMPR